MQKQKMHGKRGTEGTGGQIQAAHIGDAGDLRLDRNRAFVIGAAGKTREALLTEQDGEGVDADGVAGGSQFALHVIDREVAFAHGNSQITDAVAGGRGLRPALRLSEERGAFLRVVAELKTEDAKRRPGNSRSGGRHLRRAPHLPGKHTGGPADAGWGNQGGGKKSG